MIVSSCQYCDEQQFQSLSCVHYTIFSVVKLDLFIRALTRDHILALEKKLRVRLAYILFVLQLICNSSTISCCCLPTLPHCWGGGVRFSCFMGFRHQLLPPVCYGQGCYAGGILPQIQGQQVICGQLKRCCVVCSGMRQRGQSGDGCVEASILCRYHKRKEDLFVLSWARVRPYRASSILFDVYV